MNASTDILLSNTFKQPSQAIGPSVYSDNQSLNGLRKQALTDSSSALEAAAKEFEAFFMNEMLKSMRQASDVIGDDSMFSSSEEKMFVGMLDEQMSVDLSQQGSLGIAKMMLRDLAPELNPVEPSWVNKESSFNQPTLAVPVYSEVKKSIVNNIVVNESVVKNPVVVNPIVIRPEFNRSDPNRQELNRTESSNPFSVLTEQKSKELNLNTVTNTEVEEETKIAKEMPRKKSLFNSAQDFIKQLLPIAEKAAEKIGVNPKILVAQAALETGWGKYIIHDENGKPSFNLFGIKSGSEWKGDRVKIDTLEVESGQVIKRRENFRAYGSFEKSFDDLVKFISENPRYQKAMDTVEDAKQFIQSVQDAGYATDPNYAKKVINIFNRDTLRDF